MRRHGLDRPALVALAGIAALAVTGCSDDGGGPGSARGTTRPEEPAVTGQDLTVTGPAAGTPENAAPQDLPARGYVEREYLLAGSARAYATDGTPGKDGRWEASPAGTADYTTRLLVRRPAAAEDFSGTVVVEWFNVSGGMDAEPEWGFLHEELLRQGHAWVGVSAQEVGVSGPPPEPGSQTESLGRGGLRVADPARYGELSHPGDGFSYDIFSDAGRAVQDSGDVDLLGGFEPDLVLAVGESQSAIRLTTYLNAVHPRDRVYDGFLVHSRSGGAAPLAREDQGSIATERSVRIRTDLVEPVLTLQTETDVGAGLDFLPSRQPDTDRFRLWEVAGTAHADAYLIDALYGLGDAGRSGRICAGPINAGPQHAVAKAALRHLVAWAAGGGPPPKAPRLRVESRDPPVFERDGDGNVLGGIRTPAVDVPTATITGEAQGDGFCRLLGTTVPFTEEELDARYRTHDEYVDAVTDAAETAVRSGFLLRPEAETMIEEAEASSVGT
jgi:hypothetical protein